LPRGAKTVQREKERAKKFPGWQLPPAPYIRSQFPNAAAVLQLFPKNNVLLKIIIKCVLLKLMYYFSGRFVVFAF